MLGNECIIISINDARRILDCIGWEKSLKEMEEMQKSGLFDIWDKLKSDIRGYDYKEQLLMFGEDDD